MLERLNQPVEESEAFMFGSQAIRDALTGEASGARQGLGQAATSGGFLDSGSVIQGDIDIGQAKQIAMADAIQQLFVELEDRRERDVLPFLTGYSNRQLGLRGQDIAERGARYGMYGELGSTLLEELAKGPGSGGKGGPGGFPGKCWVARAIYGENDPRWLLARYYISNLADSTLRDLYFEHGESLAEKVRTNPLLRAHLKPEFDGMVHLAYERLVVSEAN
jgi:hypothetical protein